MNNKPVPLNGKNLASAAKHLASRDNDLARILAEHGPPPLWAREPCFTTLIRIILEQQVSLASAAAMFQRLESNMGQLTPAGMIAAGTPFLRSLGVTRQKAAYFINVAEAVQNGELNLQQLAQETDETAMEKLTAVKGIGPWTARQAKRT